MPQKKKTSYFFSVEDAGMMTKRNEIQRKDLCFLLWLFFCGLFMCVDALGYVCFDVP